MYDFRSLSPMDFENLVRDLLQAEMGIRLESFGPGKDGGIDFRYAKDGSEIVVQAKHYPDSRSDALVRTARKENSKIARLQPTRYIFATSAPMAPGLKNKLIAAMPDAPLERGDVVGREDLNALLESHGEVLRRHFKLWLTSAVVLERILKSAVYNRTDLELAAVRELVPKFVHNDSVAAAERILEANGSLIVAGEPGVGKTTLARMLIWLHLEQGWEIFVVGDFKEALEVVNPGAKRLIFFDDFLGQIELTADHIRGADQALPSFLDKVKHNKDLRFVLTTRTYLLNQAQLQSSRLDSPRVVASELVLNVGTYTRGIRAQIVFNHIYFSDLAAEQRSALVADAFYLKVIDHRNFSPRLIQLLTSAEFHALQEGATRETVMRVLSNPTALWSTPYRAHLNEDARVLMRAIFFCGYYVDIDRARAAFKRFARGAGIAVPDSEAAGRFRQALKALDGSIIHIEGKRLSFSNPGIRDFLTRVLLEDQLLESVVVSADRFEELESAWSFYSRNRAACEAALSGEGIWLKALERLESGNRGSVAQRLRLALAIGGDGETAEFHRLGGRMLDTVEAAGLQTNDVSECRALLVCLESLHDDSEFGARCKRVVLDAVADMLAEEGEYMDLADISSLTKALAECSRDAALVKTASQRALKSYVRGIDDRLMDIGSTNELESFEEDLFAAMHKCELSVDDSLQEELRSRRQLLALRDDDDEDRYRTTQLARPSAEVSDDEIKSLFGTLLSDPEE